MPRPDRLFLVACLLLAGCNDTRDLAPASPSAPWRTTEIRAHGAEAPRFATPADPALPWRGAPEAGADPVHVYSLAELIDLAQRRNRGTRIAWEQAQQAAIGVGISRADALPEITASVLGGYQRIASPFPSTLVRKGYISASAQEVFPEIAIRYLLLDFGRREAAEAQAWQISFAANVAFTAAHQQLILTVARTYFTLDGVNATLRAARRALANARTLQQSAEAMQARGLGTVVNTELARRGTAQAVYNLAQATTAQHDATYSLMEALSLPPTTTLRVEDSSARSLPHRSGRSVDALMQAALRQRPDLLAALAKLRAADAGVALARAGLRPTIGLEANIQGNIGRISVDGSAYEGVTQPQTGVFLRFNWPLYQGGLRENRLRLAQSQRAAAEDALEQASDGALRQVALAYDALGTELDQHDAAVALRTASRAAFEAARDAYQHGIGRLTDAETAEASLAAAEAAVAHAHAQTLINAAALAFATGELAASTEPVLAGTVP